MGTASSIVAVLVLAIFASACERREPAAAPSASSSAATVAPAPGPASPRPSASRGLNPERGFDTGAVTTRGPGTGDPHGSPLLRQVRFGAGPGYDRVVFEFEEYMTGGFSVAYDADADRDTLASECMAPKRRPGADLVVSFHGSGTSEDPYSGSARRSYSGRPRVRPVSTEQVVEAVLFCEFEGTLDWVLVVGERQPFRVTTLDGPPRLVVDVARRHPGGHWALGNGASASAL